MRKKAAFILTTLLTFTLLVPMAQAWNLSAKYINALTFDKDGQITFTLFEEGRGGKELRCQGSDPWFKISACSANDRVCIESVNRMASMLLAAKMENKPIHVQRDNCTVTQTALKP